MIRPAIECLPFFSSPIIRLQILNAVCRAAGADDLLRKPVAMTLLFDAIARAITERPSAATAALA